ncbi:hypothetical protein [Polluticoccus soli]|uniref:hypothetical protein n=1 Tax=Polluticoccus soli TaxID=3034150 RepID=UPI0023E1A934|nr:hypothetical protein [Flavipsychrobacter sp. JY13-12]
MLNHIELIVDRPWTIVDDKNRLITYRFKRDNSLIIAVDGQFEEWAWELLDNETIIVKHHGATSGKLFKHGFVFDGLLFLQQESVTDIPGVFYDKNIIADGDVVSYLDTYIVKRLEPIVSTSGKNFFVPKADEMKIGSIVCDKDFQPANGNLTIHGKTATVIHGRIASITSPTIMDLFEENYYWFFIIAAIISLVFIGLQL